MSETTTEATAETEALEATEEATETEEFDVERAKAKIAKQNSEAKGLRNRVKELEGYEAKIREIEEAQKSESQKIQERAEKAEREAQAARDELARERIARRYKIDDEDLDLLGSGTEEQIEARAKRIAALNTAAAAREVTAPPSGKPVEKLRPGVTANDASLAPPDAYPSHWRTAKATTSKGIGNG